MNLADLYNMGELNEEENQVPFDTTKQFDGLFAYPSESIGLQKRKSRRVESKITNGQF